MPVGQASGTRNPWLALAPMLVGSFMVMLDTTIVNIARPAMLHDLGSSLSELIWVSTGYLIAFAVPLLLAARLGDRYGPKRVFLVGLIIFTLASALCGLAIDSTMLIVGRLAQGL